MITLRFFAHIREQLGAAELQWPNPGSIAALIAELARERGPDWADALTAPQVIVAINQRVVERSSDIADGDEVAFFPPVTGG